MSPTNSRVRPLAAATMLLSAALALPAYAAKADDPFQRGRAALDKDDLPGAVAAFTEAIRLDPKRAAAYAARGWAYSELEEDQKALADFDQAIRLDPEQAEAWCNRGQVKARQGDMKDAIADFSEAIRLDPKLYEAYHARGWAYSETGDPRKAVADYGECIRLSPDDPQPRIDRATCLSSLKQHAEAVADLDEAIRLDAKLVRAFGARGAAHLHLKNYRQGMADLQTAIRLNPRDAGAAYKPSSGKQLSEEALKHGREQVARMIRDRPAMAEYAEEAAFLRDWAARKFAGEDFGEPFDWDPAPPKDSDAENVAPVDGKPGRIRVEPLHQSGPHKGTPRTFEELWAGAVFELHNITYARHFLRLYREAAAGKVTKEEFVAGIWKYEYLAAQKTRAFYARVFLPFAETQKLATDPGLWFAAWWEEADEALAGFTDKSSYPWRPYSRQYDWATVHRLYHDGKSKRALKLLEEMLAEKAYHDAADVHLWIGRCHLELIRPQAAVEAFSESIRLDPKKAAAYELRGDAYEELREKAKAKADREKARQLETGGR